jgi:ectoine hydroxylase-related dioxygenase (phytanoyl-CoA dioxygenase family)
VEQRKVFFEEGYLIIENLLSSQEIEKCQNEIERLHLQCKEFLTQNDPRKNHFQMEPFREKPNCDDGLPILRKIEGTRDLSATFDQLAKHPSLVKTVQTLIGENLLLFRSTLMLKPAFHGSAHGLHQDSAYWPMEPPKLVTVSIAINDATTENGCFKIIPRSHKSGLREWGGIARRHDDPITDRNDVDPTDQVEVPLKAGSALLFHSLMVHGSGANLSSKPRNTALYAYFSSDVRYKPRGGKSMQKTFPVIAGLNGKTELTLTSGES